MAEGDVELSIVMPVHDEASTLPQILRRLGTVEFRAPTELIIVDDGSTDGGVDGVDRAWLPNLQRVRVVRSRVNRGKGHALRRGFALAEGDFLGVQDADLEYEPAQIPELVAPLRDGRADAVFGSRQFGAASSYSFWYLVGNRFVSLAASALFDRYVTDAYTCHKFFTRSAYERLRLTADGFEIEAELTGGLLRQDARLLELPIRYTARTREEGKKIRKRDGLRALLRLVRIRLRGW